MKAETLYKKQLEKHLFGGQAFIQLDEMLKKISFEKIGVRPKELPYSFYELFYHIWFTQNDILKYCQNSDYSAPKWPKDYWPKNQAPLDPDAWKDLQTCIFRRQGETSGVDSFRRNRSFFSGSFK